jgi:lysophospholipase L1-like esterase
MRLPSFFAFIFFTLAFALGAAEPEKVRIALAGDSTVTDTAGWGKAFAARLTPEAECINLASGGQSSKSFLDGGRWAKVIAAKPAFVLIQFGHNDMPGKGPNRESDPETTYRANLLLFVKEARAAGAQPIIVTSMVRRTFDNGKIRGELRPWADAARKVAADEKVPLVDLFARSREFHDKLGSAASDEFNPPTKEGKADRTHLNEKGADAMAGIIVEELRRVCPEIAKYLR